MINLLGELSPLSGMSFGYWLLCLTFTAVVLALYYEESPKFRYYFKFAIYVAVCSLTGLIMLPLWACRPRNTRNTLWGVPFVRPVSALLGIKWEIKGKEHLAKDFPCVVISNHQSALDFLAMIELWPVMQKCAPVAKREILYVFPFGLASWLCGTVFINRSNAAECRSKISVGAEVIQKEKTKMYIYPEGTRNKRSDLLPFKKGAFHIAKQNTLPIVPVIISPYTFVNDDKKIFNSGTVLVTVLPPIETADVEDINALTDSAYNLMNDEYHRLTVEVSRLAGDSAVNVFYDKKTDGVSPTSKSNNVVGTGDQLNSANGNSVGISNIDEPAENLSNPTFGTAKKLL